ncbi:NACHT domain-containing protein [Leptolyngbya sp. BL0902]|nr:NACHT domain-containing protein [Leptolyngbya sp. BL0902]
MAAVAAEVQDRQQQSLPVAVAQAQGLPMMLPDVPLGRGCWAMPEDPPSLTTGEPIDRVALRDRFSHPTTAGQLRIAGAAGLGKTTILVELADHLGQQAEVNDQAPVPVLLHLSAKVEAEDSGLAWLVGALWHKYGVDPNLAERWLVNGEVLPLLDGWDEITPSVQAAWAAWLQPWLALGYPLVLAGQGDDLGFRTVLTLHPLPEDQLAAILGSLGQEDWWRAVSCQPERLALVRNPLCLGLALLLQEQMPATAPTWPTSEESLIDCFIDQQLRQMSAIQAPLPPPLGRKPAGRWSLLPSLAAAKPPHQWLPWLAQQHPYDELWLEAMQPHLLQGSSQRWQYRLWGGLLFGLAGGSLFGVLIGPFSGLLAFAVITLMFVLVRSRDAINTNADLYPDLPTFLRFIAVRQINFIVLISTATGIGVLLSSQSWIGFGVGLLMGLVVGLAVRLMVLLPSGLLGGLIYGLSQILGDEVALRQRPNHGIWVRLEHSLGLTALFLWLWIVLKAGVEEVLPWIAPSLVPHRFPAMALATLILALVLWATIFQNVLICVQHVALRLVLHRSGVMPWNLAQALETAQAAHLVQHLAGHYRFLHPQVRERLALKAVLEASPQSNNLNRPSRKS